MSFGEGEFKEVTAFGDEFKTVLPIIRRSLPELMAKEIIEVQPMDIPFSEDFLALQEQLQFEIRRTFGYNEATKTIHAIEQEEFFTKEEFEL
jgi:hypothetical protein